MGELRGLGGSADGVAQGFQGGRDGAFALLIGVDGLLDGGQGFTGAGFGFGFRAG